MKYIDTDSDEFEEIADAYMEVAWRMLKNNTHMPYELFVIVAGWGQFIARTRAEHFNGVGI